MQRLLLFAVAAVLSMTTRAQQTIIHDPNVEVRAVTGYHGIEVSDAINLYLSQGDKETVAVSARDINWRDRIRTVVEDGILKISLDKRGWKVGDIKLKAYVSFTALDLLRASGASDVFVDGVIAGDRFFVDLSGASDFKGAINVKQFHMDQSGASDAHITGAVAEKASFSLSGSSSVKAYDLVTQNCSVNASGASDLNITVNKDLDADVSGASNVYYKGDGVIKSVRKSGASAVKKAS
jgi:Putative auto-transporter adhesin, head GIN domain